MSEEIEIGLDPSDALKGLGDIGKAFENLSRQAGLNSREVNRANTQMEKGIATVAGALAKQTAARQKDLQTINEAITAEQKLIAIAKAQKTTGVVAADGKPARDLRSGQFVSNDSKMFYENQIALAERLGQRTEDLNRQRERSARQMQLETAFASRFYGTADEGATKLARVAGIMRQIPPATWNRALGDASSKIMDMGNSARYAMYDVSNTFGIAGAAIAGVGILAIGAAVAHERAFANVERTTQTTTEGYRQLQRQLEVMAMELPVSFEGLTNIAQAAGQLGIGAGGVAQFTSVVAKLSATTNLTSDAAGIALARFRAFFSEAKDPSLAVTEATFNNLASSILKVGVNSIASETGIVNVATQIASMADYAGFTANQVIGLAGALSSIGVAPELARGTITRTFSLIGNAVSAGGVQLEKFASLAGISSAEFKQAWGTDQFAGVFTNLVGGIRDLGNSGKDANLALMDLGFASVRDRPLLLRLAEAANEAGQSGGLLAQTMRDAEDGWRQNSELALQYAKISTTTAARLQVLGQAFEQFAATTGRASGGFLGEVAVQLTGVVRGFEEMANSDAGQFLGSFAVQAALVVGALALLVAAGARTVASLQGIGVAYREMSAAGIASLGKLSAAFRILSLSMGVLGIVATIGLAIAGFVAMGDASAKANRALQDTSGLVQAMATDAKSGAQGITFYANSNEDAARKQADAAKQANGMTEALRGIKPSADAGAAGMDNLAKASDRAKYVFGDAAQEFYRSQLLQSEAFQSLFDPSKQYGSSELNNFFGQGFTLESMGIDPSMLDWDKFMRDSLTGGVDTDAIFKDLLKQSGTVQFDSEGRLTAEAANIQNYANTIGTTYGNVKNSIQGTIDAQSALTMASSQAFEEYSEGAIDAAALMGRLDEVTQKTVDKMAGGMAKFVDMGKLIKITQDGATQSAEEYESAWTNAYGGASFSLESYLVNFRRAAQEQANFSANLQILSGTGIDTSIIADLAAMGPEANRLVQAMVDDLNTTGGTGLAEFTDLWGRTGYDAMVAFAVQAQLGQSLINQIMATGGVDALKAFNTELASGKGVPEALAAVQRDVDGKPIVPKANAPVVPNMSQSEKNRWATNNTLWTTAYVTFRGSAAIRSNPTTGGHSVENFYASGGYVSGPGTGTSDSIPARLSRGEFVMTAAATRAIGAKNLYSMMKSAQGGRPAPRGAAGGYAAGGMVGSSVGLQIVSLSPDDRALLRSLQPLVRIGNRDIQQAGADASFRSTREGVG